MVYNWDAHKDVITRLYTVEGWEVDQIIEHMHKKYNFSPSKRAYQSQFRRWQLPSKYQPALKNDALVTRVKELWTANLSQADMLETLNNEGFSIKARELHRVRTTHRWLLRAPTANGRIETPKESNDDAGPIIDGTLDQQLLIGSAVGPVHRYTCLSAEERKREMEAESMERYLTKKRRRRTRQYAGMPADPPAPPRFPSETTLAESQEILGLDKSLYSEIRQQFQNICKTAGIIKKSSAGAGAWDDAKSDLISKFEHLQTILWNHGTNTELKTLALDVICCDVTKRMRESLEKPLTMTEVKRALGLNPETTRVARSVFYKILEADGFSSKVALGSGRWLQLKKKWIHECEPLRKTLAGLGNRQMHRQQDLDIKNKAVEALATDIMKRFRDDLRKRKDSRPEPTATSLDDLGYADPSGSIQQLPGDASSFAAMLVPDQNHHVHPPHMLPEHLLDAQMSMEMPMDAGLDQPLLLDPNAQGGFMTTQQQFIAGPESLSAGTSPFDASQASVFRPATAVYLRQMNDVGTMGDLWIGFLSSPSPSLEELRQVAAQKLPGSTCTDVEGLMKVPGMVGQSVGLRVQNDAQLAAYLSQEVSPTFHVRLRPMYPG